MSDPLRIDHVEAYPDGWLGMTFTPGRQDFGFRTWKHERDLDADIARMLEERIDTFVWLVQDHELPIMEVVGLPDAMAAAGIELVRYPIGDLGVPEDAAAFHTFIDDLHARLGRGQRVAVACRGGIGRTGTVVGCLLRDRGFGPEEAIQATRDARSPYMIETDEQEDFVREWGSPA